MVANSKLRILWQSNAPWCPTGYGVQARHILPRMKRSPYVEDVGIFAFWGLQGGVWTCELDGLKFKVYPSAFDVWGNDVIADHVQDFRAQVVITLVDVWVLREDYGSGVYWLPYMPVDTLTLPRPIEVRLRKAYLPIVYSRYGSKLLVDAGIEHVYIPHGVDTSVYRPLSSASRRKYRKWLGLDPDGFVVGMVAANKSWPSRKGFAEAMQAVAALRERHNDAQLYIHTVSSNRLGGPDLCEMSQAYGIADCTRFTRDYYAYLGLEPASMAGIYNAFDVLLNPSMGEGFGIPIVEAQACGVPVIVTDATSMSELCGAGWKVPWREKFYVPLGSWQVIPDTAAVIDALVEAYDKRGDAEMAAQARNFALAYDWQVVWNTGWVPLLDRLSNELSERKYVFTQPSLIRDGGDKSAVFGFTQPAMTLRAKGAAAAQRESYGVA